MLYFDVAAGTIEVTDKDKQKQDINKLNRYTKNTLNKLEQIFDKDKILTQPELAKVFGEVGFKAAGDIINKFGIKEGSAQAIAIHGIIGGIMAELNGGGFAEGMSEAALNNLVISKLGDMKDENGKSIFNAAELRWISATVGATVSKVVGGNAGQGAGIADSATRNNWLTHDQQQKMTEKLSKVTTPEERQAILKEYYELSEQNILADSSQKEHIEPETITGLETLKKLGDAGIYFVIDENQGMHNNLKAAVDFYNIYNVVKYGPDVFTNVVFGTAALISSPIAVVSGAITYGGVTYTLYKDYQNAEGDMGQLAQNVEVEARKAFVLTVIDRVTGIKGSAIMIITKSGVSVFMDAVLKN